MKENFEFPKLSKNSKNRREAAKIFWPKIEGGREVFSKSQNKNDIDRNPARMLARMIELVLEELEDAATGWLSLPVDSRTVSAR